jgi:hypothetical protein
MVWETSRRYLTGSSYRLILTVKIQDWTLKIQNGGLKSAADGAVLIESIASPQLDAFGGDVDSETFVPDSGSVLNLHR